MTTPLNAKGYYLTKEKLANMEARLAALRSRTDLHPIHKSDVERSYQEMIQQYRRDVILYEAVHPEVQPVENAPKSEGQH